MEGVSYYCGGTSWEVGVGRIMGDSRGGDEFGLIEVPFSNAFTASSGLFVLPVLFGFDKAHYVDIVVYGFLANLEEFCIVVL
jgi:hypothetical protein